MYRYLLSLSLCTSLIAGCSNNALLSNQGIAVLGDASKALTISADSLRAESVKSVAKMDEENPLASDSSPYNIRLKRLTQQFQSIDGIPLNFKVYKVNELNAFATPDGSVRVYSGLMDLLQDDDELLAVIGHEIGHVYHQHSLDQYKKAYLASAGRRSVALATSGTILGNLVGSQYGQIAENFVNAKFSRDDELQSDRYSVKVLNQLGRDPYAAVRVHRKFLKAMGNGGGFMSSHPSSQQRIDQLETEIATR